MFRIFDYFLWACPFCNWKHGYEQNTRVHSHSIALFLSWFDLHNAFAYIHRILVFSGPSPDIDIVLSVLLQSTLPTGHDVGKPSAPVPGPATSDLSGPRNQNGSVRRPPKRKAVESTLPPSPIFTGPECQYCVRLKLSALAFVEPFFFCYDWFKLKLSYGLIQGF